MVLSSPQRGGTIGSALSGSSVRSRSSWPILRRKALWPSTPMPSAILAVPMFDEWMNTSGTVRTRWVRVVVVDREAAVAQAPTRASKVELMLTLPESSAIAIVSALKVEPIS